MKKSAKIIGLLCIVLAMTLCFAGCGSKESDESVNKNDATTTTSEEASSTDKASPSDAVEKASPTKEPSSSKNAKQGGHVAVTDLKPSEGLEFESNNDGTCTITGLGSCMDEDIVIPEKSPKGDTVTLIDEYAFLSLEDVESVTLVNYNYEVDTHAFQYGEIAAVNVMGGNLVLGESSFSSCEKLTAISFSECNVQIDEYAFLSCGKDANVTFEGCTGTIDERAFQYGDIASLSISNSELKIDKSAFSSCESLTSIVFANSTLEVGEYAFLSCGDSAKVEMSNCSMNLDKRAFQYASIASLAITGDKLEAGDSVFSSCDELATVTIDCGSTTLGEYAFLSCQDLANVSICDNGKSNNTIEIDDRAFQYCEKLESVVIGKGAVSVGKRAFSGCADDIAISVNGNSYTVKSIEDGIS